MQVNGNTANTDPTAGASGSNGSGATSPNEQLTQDSFIQLLAAQLRAQTPDNTLDPNQMMNELVSFNSLQQLMDIHQILGQTPTTTSDSGTNSSTGGSANPSGGAARA